MSKDNSKSTLCSKCGKYAFTIQPHVCEAVGVVDFWTKCAELGCVVVPLFVYSQYNPEGDTSESDFIGMRFIALPMDSEAVGPEFYFGIEQHWAGDYHKLFSSPEEALQDFASTHTNHQSNQ